MEQGTKKILGTGKIRKHFIFGEQGDKPIYVRGIKEQVPQQEDLNIVQP